MPNKKITVSFDPEGGDWEFDPEVTRMNVKGAIHFVRDASSPKWEFVSFNPRPQGWSYCVNDDGSKLTVHDSLLPPQGTIHYTITVLYKNEYYTSRRKHRGPPIIMNEAR